MDMEVVVMEANEVVEDEFFPRYDQLEDLQHNLLKYSEVFLQHSLRMGVVDTVVVADTDITKIYRFSFLYSIKPGWVIIYNPFNLKGRFCTEFDQFL